MKLLVVLLNPGTWESVGHCESRLSQKDSFWSTVCGVSARTCFCVRIKCVFRYYQRKPYFVFPPIVGLELVRNLSLDIARKVEVGFGDLKLSIDLVYSDAVVDETEEADGLGGLEQLLDNLRLPSVEI
jgi:hypothetical protein